MTETEGAPSGRYGVELRQPGGGPGDGLWMRVTIFREDAIPTSLSFDNLDEARAYAGRPLPGTARIVRVDDEDGREVVEYVDGPMRGA